MMQYSQTCSKCCLCTVATAVGRLLLSHTYLKTSPVLEGTELKHTHWRHATKLLTRKGGHSEKLRFLLFVCLLRKNVHSSLSPAIVLNPLPGAIQNPYVAQETFMTSSSSPPFHVQNTIKFLLFKGLAFIKVAMPMASCSPKCGVTRR